jgi:hypothetical protein
MRGVLLGVVLTLGAQLLLVLLLRTLWAQRALASLDSWLQHTFGVSLQRPGRDGGGGFCGSASSDRMREGVADDLWDDDDDGRALGGNGKPLTRSGSDASSSSSAYSNGSSASGEQCCRGVCSVGWGQVVAACVNKGGAGMLLALCVCVFVVPRCALRAACASPCHALSPCGTRTWLCSLLQS